MSQYLFSYWSPTEAVQKFLNIFGATMNKGSVYFDKTGIPLVITRKIFEDGNGNFKWMTISKKENRLQCVNLMEASLIEPDEILWYWEEDQSQKGSWLLKRGYLRNFETEETKKICDSLI